MSNNQTQKFIFLFGCVLWSLWLIRNDCACFWDTVVFSPNSGVFVLSLTCRDGIFWAKRRYNSGSTWWYKVLGNSGKPVTLETSSLTKFLRCVFQGQSIRDFQESWICEVSESRTGDFRESWICEASESRACDFRESWTCEASESRTCGSLESRISEVMNFRRRETQECVGGLVGRSWIGKYTNHWEAKSKLPSQKVRV
jgi:hypothetical protein